MDFTRICLWLYTRLLHLYPRPFYEQYAQEMREVFNLHLQQSTQQGKLILLTMLIRELFDLPANIVREYLRKENRPMNWFRLRGENSTHRARNLTRAASLVVAFFVNWTLLAIWLKPDFNLWSQSVPYVVTLFITNLFLLVAWRWERMGACLILLGAVAVGVTVAYSMFVTASIQNVDIPAFIILLVAAAWALPYILFGLLFLNFSRREAILIST